VLNREKQLDVVRELTDIVGAAAGDPTLVNRTWMLITEAAEGGWGINRQQTRARKLSSQPVQSQEIQSELKILETLFVICPEEKS
jgi:phenylpyruvate tautomerase PptA (4-oxalocrotonate tautomerase family)